MAIITISLQFLFKLLLFIFVPVLIIVSILWIKLSKYSKKNRDDINHDYNINFYSYITSIIITVALLIVDTSFTVYFTHTMRVENLIQGNEIIYYCILFSPVIPLICFLYYTVRLCRLIAKGKNKEIEEYEVKENEIEVL